MARQYRYWNERDTGRLREMVANGSADDEIAAALGRTVESVIQRRRIMGIKRPRGGVRPVKNTRISKAETILATTPGLIFDSVFERFGISQEQVRRCRVEAHRVYGAGWRRAL